MSELNENIEHCKKLPEKRKLSKLSLIMIILALVGIIFEIAVYFSKLPYEKPVDANEYCTKKTENGEYKISFSTDLKFRYTDSVIKSISFKAGLENKGDANNEPAEITVSAYSKSVGERIVYKTEKFAIGANKPSTVYINLEIPRANSDIILNFSENFSDYVISDMRFNDGKDLKFNFLRLSFYLLILAVIFIFCKFGIFKIVFNKDSKKCGYAALAFVLSCTLFAVLLSSLLCCAKFNVKYPFENDVKAYNPYEQQFDAFMKGQTHIDSLPSKELLEVKNPYDPSMRSDIEYLWDRALYDGKYYSYFGIAPVLTIYFPYYALTGSLPSEDTVVSILAVLMSLFFSMACIKWASMYTKKLHIVTMFTVIFAALMSSQVFLIMRGEARFYYIATLSSMMFTSLFVWLLLCGLSKTVRLKASEKHPEKTGFRILYYVLAGIAYGFMFLSRYNAAIMTSLIVIVFIIFNVISKRDQYGKIKIRKPKKIISELLALGLPVFSFVLFQLAFNYVRFENIFEFGTNYQLTVSDISENVIRITDLPYALFHYFVQPLTISSEFPYVNMDRIYLQGGYGHYSYIDTGMGLLAIPMMLFLIAGVFLLLKKSENKNSREHKFMFSALLLGLIITALCNFCKGGYIFRYVGDMTVLSAFAAMTIMFGFCEISKQEVSFREHRTVYSGISESVCVFVAVLSVFVSLFLSVSLNGHLSFYNPIVFEKLREIFSIF